MDWPFWDFVGASGRPKAMGRPPSTHDKEAVRTKYEVSPWNLWPHYQKAAQAIGIPIPGHDFGVDEQASASEDSEESDDEESDDEERSLPQVRAVSRPRPRPLPRGLLNVSDPNFHEQLAAFIASGGTCVNGKLIPPIASGANVTSNKRTAATAAADSSKKAKTRAEVNGLDNRPAWMVQMEREKMLSSSSFEKEDTKCAPNMSWGKPQSTAPRSAAIMSWGKPQSTASRSAPSMSWGKPQSTEPTSSNKWTYRYFWEQLVDSLVLYFIYFIVACYFKKILLTSFIVRSVSALIKMPQNSIFLFDSIVFGNYK